jgi:hypothetical protein
MTEFEEKGQAAASVQNFAIAIDQFNRGEWFDCHETLEELWVGETGWRRDLYQGILQVAVALHHWQEGNFAGATLLLGQAVKLLHLVEGCGETIDVTALVNNSDRLRRELLALGPARQAELDRSLIPVIRWTTTPPDPGA